MKTERLIEILNLVRHELIFDENGYHDLGICGVFTYLKLYCFISVVESNKTIRYIYDNKPNKDNEYSEFMDNEYWCDKLCWWSRMCVVPETRQIRVDYLSKLIANIK